MREEGLVKTADSHAHLVDERFAPDREEVIRALPEKGIEFVITVGDDIENSQRSLELANEHDSLYCTAGFHPHYAAQYSDESRKRLLQLLKEPKVKALGEIGLDYHYLFSPADIQKKVFKELLHLGLENNKPIIIHNRKSDADLLSILRETGCSSFKGIIHCFDSDIVFARQCLDLGFSVSFSGMITFTKSMQLLEAVAFVPLDRLLIETDAPYLTPSPMRGKRNEPAFVRYVGEKVAQIKKIPVEEVFEETKKNASLIYDLVAEPRVFS
jgi:TatD DNase family protein